MFAGTTLLSAVGNRVHEADLTHTTSSTLPVEALFPITQLALSPSGGGAHLLAIDAQGHGLLINRHRRVILHRIKFRSPVACARFSPDGAYFAVAAGRVLQVWRTPALRKEFAPFALHRAYGGSSDDITCLAWSTDGSLVAAGSRDLATRVYSRDPLAGYLPPALGGHREPLVGAFFDGMLGGAGAGAGPAALSRGIVVVGAAGALPNGPLSLLPSDVGAGGKVLYTLSRDGALFVWVLTASAAAAGGAAHGGAASKARGASAGSWSLAAKHYFCQDGAKLTCCDYHPGTGEISRPEPSCCSSSHGGERERLN